MWVENHVRALSLEQKVAQCLVAIPGVGADGLPDEATASAVSAGLGILHSVTDMTASQAARYHAAIVRIAAEAGVPPTLISGNLESGVGYSLGATGTDFPYPRGIGIAGDEDLAYRVARQSAEEARILGYHWTFSPCTDVIATSSDPILGVRAYGVDSRLTGVLGAAQVRGYQDGGLLATAKHFPGHGDSHVDSHLGLPRIDRSESDHEGMHMPPFVAAIDAGVASIMVAHVTLPAQGIDGPASLSSVVNREWLRRDLGYTGVIISDSLRMNAISALYPPATAALLALQAGADVANVKSPAAEIPEIVNVIVAAVRNGELPETDLDEAVRRLLIARVAVGAHRASAINEAAAAAIDAPTEWVDPERPATVSVSGAHAPVLSLTGRYTVIGDSPLAHRLVELLSQRGFDTALLDRGATEQAIRTAVNEHVGEVIPVYTPSTAMTGQEYQNIVGSTPDASTRQRIAAALINSPLPASSFATVSTTVITLPAVDTFGIVSDAAVHAAIDRLT